MKLTDRELLIKIRDIVDMDKGADWIHDYYSTPNEEFEHIYDLIVEHLEKEPTWDMK